MAAIFDVFLQIRFQNSQNPYFQICKWVGTTMVGFGTHFEILSLSSILLNYVFIFNPADFGWAEGGGEDPKTWGGEAGQWEPSPPRHRHRSSPWPVAASPSLALPCAGPDPSLCPSPAPPSWLTALKTLASLVPPCTWSWTSPTARKYICFSRWWSVLLIIDAKMPASRAVTGVFGKLEGYCEYFQYPDMIFKCLVFLKKTHICENTWNKPIYLNVVCFSIYAFLLFSGTSCWTPPWTGGRGRGWKSWGSWSRRPLGKLETKTRIKILIWVQLEIQIPPYFYTKYFKILQECAPGSPKPWDSFGLSRKFF